MTTFPAWISHPCEPDPPAHARCDLPLPDGMRSAIAQAAAELAASPTTLLLAAHARLLAALTGERVVTIGLDPGLGLGLDAAADAGTEGAARACTIAVGGAWRDLVAACEDARGGGAVAGATYGSLVGRGAPEEGGTLPLGVAVQVWWEPGALALRYAPGLVDAAYARRIAGYHLAALARLIDDPDGAVEAGSLVSDREIREQVDGLAGPLRPLPERRLHELIEDNVRAHPHRPAAAQGTREWTYGQLNARADAIGRALLATGLRPEGVVAVATDRTLEWLAAVLGILKAGGAYLPVDPAHPADRIARVLRRADCGHALTQAVSRAGLDAAVDALAGRTDAVPPVVLDLDSILTGAPAGGQVDTAADLPVGLGVDIGGDRLAYLYFTSGSTGEPKGAMCEHAGMLNHVLAKIEDLGVRPGDTVAQTAPQCFDISLWQLLAALVAGGRTLIVEQEVILDAERFVEVLAAADVAVLQVVPSYLEVVLGYLESHPRPLPALRCVSVTGEALKAQLARRWFAGGPATRLVNAYGLTETSDDTNHHVMDGPPSTARVPLGLPIRNARVYVVDDRLVPVPLGAPGEIVFAGVCVGRGYVNDPERTARAYLVDPFHAGDRLYRSGDIGRWSPDGTLDFLGRRDHQVKIAGFRIEIGEVEDALTRAVGVREAAVVVLDVPGRERRLVGFYAADAPLQAQQLRDVIGARVPGYMVPRTLHHRATLPLTANGKIDRAALTDLAARLEGSEPAAVRGRANGPAATPAPAVDRRAARASAPATPTEIRVADAWAAVLGLAPGQIGRRDHFFERGGTSLAAVKLAIALDRAVTPRDLLAHPVLADLAAVIDAATRCTPGTTDTSGVAGTTGIAGTTGTTGTTTIRQLT